MNNKVKLTFLVNNDTMEVEAPVGLTVLEVARHNDIDLEGACEGSLACSTCHVVLEENLYNQIPKPEEDEEDMLDLAFGLEKTSRLGCQLTIDRAWDNTIIRIPKSRNIK